MGSRHTTSVRRAAMFLCGLGLVAQVSVSSADPTPIPIGPAPSPVPAGKAPKFPMSSTEFRPYFEKLMSNLEAAAAKAQGKTPRPPPSGWADQMRFRASQATEDGIVTATEFTYIVSVIRHK